MVVKKKGMDELSNLQEYVVLATVSSKKYHETNLKIIKYLTKKESTPGVYVTLNRPFNTVKKQLKEKGVDTSLIIFIDAITKVAGATKKTKECLFLGSPENLSDISFSMDQAVRSLPAKKKFVFFDSLSTLLIYNKAQTVAKFIHFLASKMRIWKVKGIIISLKKDSDKELIDELTQFCDKVLNLGG
ncbi:MAG: ATPase domain-containing protein [Nanoarchaeota archaeon]|nr:hypothetical protein [Nanoarchaeota archaeon]MBU1632118.1 hypothetical protein [Nanoarchaeota archaeon]MBU1876183.1 hypothetical protein [Nanoarchaeota archaeon]